MGYAERNGRNGMRNPPKPKGPGHTRSPYHPMNLVGGGTAQRKFRRTRNEQPVTTFTREGNGPRRQRNRRRNRAARLTRRRNRGG